MKVIGVILAVLLTVASIALMFPQVVQENFPEINLENDFVNFEDTSIKAFPFYGGSGEEATYGVCDIVRSYEEYVVEGTEPVPEILPQLEKIAARGDLWQKLYDFVMIALMTIPIYMVLRLIAYNGAYSAGARLVWPVKMLWYGLVGSSVSLVTVTVSWFAYKTVVFDIVVEWLKKLIEDATDSVNLALATSNITTISVVGLIVFLLLRATLFRGSIFTSLVGALLRTLLYVLIFAVIEVFLYRMTGRTCLFMLAAIVVIGLIKILFLRDKHAT